MAFIRLKRIAGKQYAVLVENTWTPRGPRQSARQYLGRFVPLDATEAIAGAADTAVLIRQELLAAGFSEKLTLGPIKVNLQLCTVREGKKRVVLGLNGGYLCDYTLRRLLRFQPVEEVTPGYALARAFSDAGIRVGRDDFVQIYTKTYKRATTS